MPLPDQNSKHSINLVRRKLEATFIITPCRITAGRQIGLQIETCLPLNLIELTGQAIIISPHRDTGEISIDFSWHGTQSKCVYVSMVRSGTVKSEMVQSHTRIINDVEGNHFIQVADAGTLKPCYRYLLWLSSRQSISTLIGWVA